MFYRFNYIQDIRKNIVQQIHNWANTKYTKINRVLVFARKRIRADIWKNEITDDLHNILGYRTDNEIIPIDKMKKIILSTKK